MKTLYHNGQFVPMTSEDDTFEALLVADDGTIAFTGSLVEARERAEDASEIDLAGKTVLPGFIDGHSHFTGTTQYLLNPDLSACRSFADIQNVLRDFIQKRGIDENGVVMAIGYDQNALAERRHPTKDVLDEVSRDIPIVVMQASNHMGVANSKALELPGGRRAARFYRHVRQDRPRREAEAGHRVVPHVRPRRRRPAGALR